MRANGDLNGCNSSVVSLASSNSIGLAGGRVSSRLFIEPGFAATRQWECDTTQSSGGRDD